MSGILKSSVQLFAEWRALLTPSGGGVLSPTAVATAGPEAPDGNPLPPGNVRARWGAMSVAYRPDTLATFH
jgi:hypothetical protein